MLKKEKNKTIIPIQVKESQKQTKLKITILSGKINYKKLNF